VLCTLNLVVSSGEVGMGDQGQPVILHEENEEES
jgi:hypothetical protein